MLQNLLKQKILILDGAMGSNLQKYNLSEDNFRGKLLKNHNIDLKGNNDILSLTRPDVIRDIHKRFLEAGADIIETNTFSSNTISQHEYGLSHLIKEMNIASIKLARKIADKYSTPDKPRFIAGSIGPTGKTASISPDVEKPYFRNITFDELYEAYYEQAEIMAQFEVDIFLVETIFDTLNAKAALYAIKQVLKKYQKDIPIMISATLTDKSGRTLSGQKLEAFYYSIEHADPISVGINCAMGIDDMKPHIRELSDIASCYISLYANAGLPDAFGNYPDSPEKMAKGYLDLARGGYINIAGGCCGTTPSHIRAIADSLKGIKPRALPEKKNICAFSGLEPFIYKQENNNFIMVGERTNVTGSAKFAKLIEGKKLDEAVYIAHQQVENGANIIDINMDKGLIDSKSMMIDFLNYIAVEPDVAKVPFMVDSSKFEVIESGLKCIQGKAIVNSISLKEGEEKFINHALKIHELGAAMVIMAFDEVGQAATTERRVEIVERSYKILNSIGIKDEDMIFDLNIFPVATGMKEHNINAISFIEATRIIKKKHPKVLISGGISNLSFSFRGLNRVRQALHSVFLYHAINAGMNMGIVNAGMIEIYDDIEEPLKTLCENVILNKSDDAGEKLLEYAQNNHLEAKNQTSENKNEWRNDSVEQRLQYALIKGNIEFLEDDIKEALKKYSPVELIEKPLMNGMDKIGILFGEGKMFLPQVVKSAIIIYDAAYECFIDRHSSLPKSIYEIEGAKNCAIEICSLSKMAGFTGTRCGYTIVPENLIFDEMSLNKMWLRRQTTKFNGVAYIIQKGAEAVFTPEGQQEIRENINYYKNNAKLMAETLKKHNIYFTGGINSPYIWLKCPNNMGSWEFFDYLLEKIAVVGTPGAGFGKFGEGYLRLTSFGTYEATKEAMDRLDKLLS